jgi:hypothetical protein
MPRGGKSTLLSITPSTLLSILLSIATKHVKVLLKAESKAGQKGKEVKPFDSESIG